MIDPNSFSQDELNASTANSTTLEEGTEQTATVQTESPAVAIDYKTKFTHSSQEALRLKAEADQLRREKAELEERLAQGTTITPSYSDELYPNFNDLDEESRRNLVAYTENIKRNVQKDLYNDPAISFARETYNEKKWNDAFHDLTTEFPDVAANADEFKAKFFNKDNVPTNIGDILKDVAKIYLFDKAKEIGASEERSKAERLEIDVATGGDRVPAQQRSMEDWQRLANTNPAKFAQLQNEFNEDMKRG